MKTFITIFILSIFLVSNFYAKSQTTTTIDYSYQTFTTACNIFATTQTVSGYDHLTTLSRPKYDDNSVVLECTPSPLATTIYSIKYSFKIGYRYQISVYYKGEKATSDGYYPSVLIQASATNGATSSSSGTDCVGPSAISASAANAFVAGYSNSSYAWANNLIDIRANTNADYLLVSALNARTGNSQTAKIYVRKIQIIETPPTFTLNPSPTVDVPLNSTSSKVFTVTNVDNAAGATYEWNLGNSNGWLYNGLAAPATILTSNSLTLTPSSNCTTLSTVSVTVKLNGINFQTLNCNITRSSVSYITIASAQSDCNTVTFTATNPSNLSSYTWNFDGDLNVNSATSGIGTTSNYITVSGTYGNAYVQSTSCSISLYGSIIYGPFDRQINGLYPEYTSGDQVSVSVNTTGYDSYYRWYVNGTLIKEGSDYTYCTCAYDAPDLRVCGDNTIRVEVETSCGVTTSSPEEHFSKICGYGYKANPTLLSTKLSEDQKMGSKTLSLYPNPVKDVLSISLPDSINTANATIKISDMFGRLVKNITKVSNNNTIAFSNFASGIYLIEIYDGTKRITVKKIIKN